MRAARPLPLQQRGIALVAAIFLLVTLAALGAFAVRIGLFQQQTVTSSLRAAQAFHAARSGIAWAAHEALSSGWCGSSTLTLSEAGTQGFRVRVDCASSTHNEGAATTTVYVIETLAEAGSYGGPDYVSRRIQAKVTDAS